MFKGSLFDKEMAVKKTVISLIFAFAVLVPALAFSQTVQLPDYTKWTRPSEVEKWPVVLNGKDTDLAAETWQQTDTIALRRHIIRVVYDEQKNPWLAFYVYEIGQKQGENVTTKETHYYLFENIKGKWELVRDFSGSNDVAKDANEFLRQNYKLEFR